MVYGREWFDNSGGAGGLCKIIGFICTVSCIVSMLTITAISINRYIHICLGNIVSIFVDPQQQRYIWNLLYMSDSAISRWASSFFGERRAADIKFSVFVSKTFLHTSGCFNPKRWFSLLDVFILCHWDFKKKKWVSEKCVGGCGKLRYGMVWTSLVSWGPKNTHLHLNSSWCNPPLSVSVVHQNLYEVKNLVLLLCTLVRAFHNANPSLYWTGRLQVSDNTLLVNAELSKLEQRLFKSQIASVHLPKCLHFSLMRSYKKSAPEPPISEHLSDFRKKNYFHCRFNFLLLWRVVVWWNFGSFLP